MFLDNVVLQTERFLTWRKRRIMKKKKRQANKKLVRDWIEAFLWAAGVVLLINQYLFQAYMIPSGSMKNTLLEQDRIFVNKVVYGPEVLPGIGKLKGLKTPERSEIIIFENPQYKSKGTLFDIVQRGLYMLTLSFVDIDYEIDKNGERALAKHFLIKRNIGVSGDRIRLIEGMFEFKPEGFSEWVPEETFKEMIQINYPNTRFLGSRPIIYDRYKSKAVLKAAEENNISGNKIPHFDYTDSALSKDPELSAYENYKSKEAHAVQPFNINSASVYIKGDMGWYIPEGWLLPLGDNRDNSKDGRRFGLVSNKKVLGRAAFKYWPLNRIGSIK